MDHAGSRLLVARSATRHGADDTMHGSQRCYKHATLPTRKGACRVPAVSLPHGTQGSDARSTAPAQGGDGALSCSQGGRVSWPPACMVCISSLDDHEAWQLLDIVQDAYSFT